MNFLPALLLLAATAMAQIRGPQLGWVFQDGRARPIHGIPGAAITGAPLDLEVGEMTASGEVALALAGEAREPVLVTPERVERIAGAMTGVERMALSPRGEAAVLYAAGRIQVLRAWNVAWESDLGYLDEAPRVLAISDDGQAVLATAGDATYAIGAAGDVKRVPLAARAMTFLRDSRNAVLATDTDVVLLTEAGSARLYDGLRRPVGIGIDRGNRRVLVADAGVGSVILLDLNGGDPVVVECGFEPETLAPLGGGAFRLTASPLRIFYAGSGDAGSGDAASGEIFIVPPGGER